MKYKVIGNLGYNWFSKIPEEDNTVFLMKDDWDDFGFRTTYHIAICINNQKIRVGMTKIMRIGQKEGQYALEEGELKIPLAKNYISFGTQEFYETIASLREQNLEYIYPELLKNLRDVVYIGEIPSDFKSQDAFTTSLLRSNSSFNIPLYHSILEGQIEQTHFNTKLTLFPRNNETNPITLEFKTDPDSLPPSNIHAIIGQNACGKTHLLNLLGKRLSKHLPTSPDTTREFGSYRTTGFTDDELDDNHYRSISLDNIEFTKCIHILVSPQSQQKHSTEELQKLLTEEGLQKYIKVGINLDTSELSEKLEYYLQNFISRDVVRKRWEEMIKQLCSDSLFEELELDKEFNEPNGQITHIIAQFNKASSGHQYMIFILVVLVQYVDDRTLVIIDEPENHLHPPLLSSFIRMLSDLLKQRNAMAILATHSPVVLQEVSSSCVWYMKRYGDVVTVRRPEIETFGETFGALLHEVFHLEVKNSGFYSLLDSVVNTKDETNEYLTYDQIMTKFNNSIGLEGRSLLSTLVRQRDSKNETH